MIAPIDPILYTGTDSLIILHAAIYTTIIKIPCRNEPKQSVNNERYCMSKLAPMDQRLYFKKAYLLPFVINFPPIIAPMHLPKREQRLMILLF